MNRFEMLACALMSAAAVQACEIVPPAQVDGTKGLAVEELKHHLALKADEVPYKFVFAKPDGAAEAAAFESRYCVKGGTVWFWGDDGGSGVTWDWGDNRGLESQRHNGTLFAVEYFAEKELGMHFLWPGKNGVSVKKVKKLVLKDGAEGRYQSALLKARIRSYAKYHPYTWDELKGLMPRELFDAARPTTHAERLLWQKRNRLQDKAYFTYGHAFTHWKDRFEKTHPEYFNLHVDPKTGKEERGYTGRSGLRSVTKHCVSNEGVVDQIIADWLAGGTNAFLNVCENDWTFWCECADCRKLDVPKEGEEPLTHVTDRYVNFWNRIAKKARAIRPDVMLVTYIYSGYHLPPRRERLEYPDNMLCGFVCDETENCLQLVEQWNKAGMKNMFLRPNYLHSIVTLHRGYERYFYNQFQTLLKRGMIGCDYDANDNRPMTTLEFYVMAKTFADPTLSFESIMDDYCSGYGAAADEVKRYFADVRQTGEAARDLGEKLALEGGSDFGHRATLPRTEETGRTEAEVRAKWDYLQNVLTRHTLAGDLTAVELERLTNLALQAEHGLLTFRFLSAVEHAPIEDLKARARALTNFRTAHRVDLPDIYIQIYRLWWAEVRYWKMYNKRVSAGK